MKTGLVIFVRFDSRRLPGKALRMLAGKPLLSHVIERAAAVGDYPIIVATSDRTIDDRIAAFALAASVQVFRGSAEDVLGRANACVRSFGLDCLVRVCGDSPFFDSALAARMLADARPGQFDLLTNVWPRTFPKGLSVETIAAEALAAAAAAASVDEREHMTQHFYAHPQRFRIANYASGNPAFADCSLAVDTEADLARASWIYERCNGKIPTPPTLVALAQEWRPSVAVQ